MKPGNQSGAAGDEAAADLGIALLQALSEAGGTLAWEQAERAIRASKHGLANVLAPMKEQGLVSQLGFTHGAAIRLEVKGAHALALAATLGSLEAAVDALEHVADQVPHELVDQLQGLSSVSLERCTVVTFYKRFHEQSRRELRAWADKIGAPLREPNQARENYLIWGRSGEGKSFFVDAIAAEQGSLIDYLKFNLAEGTESELEAVLENVRSGAKPVLCLVDEVDAGAEMKWPYDRLFAALDWNKSEDCTVVFVLIGSTPGGLAALERGMSTRWKGPDLLSRVPDAHRFEVPASTPEDLVVIFGSHLMGSNDEVHVEKLALYYVLSSQERSKPRQLSELAGAARTRTGGSGTVRFEDLFDMAQRRAQRQFLVTNAAATTLLGDTFVVVRR